MEQRSQATDGESRQVRRFSFVSCVAAVTILQWGKTGGLQTQLTITIASETTRRVKSQIYGKEFITKHNLLYGLGMFIWFWPLRKTISQHVQNDVNLTRVLYLALAGR